MVKSYYRLWYGRGHYQLHIPRFPRTKAPAVARKVEAMNAFTRCHWSRAVWIFVGCIILAGCGFKQSKQDAEKVLARHFQCVASNDYTGAMTDYGAPFFQKTTKDEWSKTLIKLHNQLGAYQGYTVTGWRVFKNAGTWGAGTTVSLQCQVDYSKYSATENFTLFKGTKDDDYKIRAHFINSEGLLK